MRIQHQTGVLGTISDAISNLYDAKTSKGQSYAERWTIYNKGRLDSLVVYAPVWHAVDLRSIPARQPLGIFKIKMCI